MPGALTADGAYAFDGAGNVTATYVQRPRVLTALHLPGVALEIRRERGSIVVYEWWETSVDLAAKENSVERAR
jgi:hypothetical protein